MWPTCSENENFPTELISVTGYNLEPLIEVRLQVLRLKIGHQIRILVEQSHVIFQLKWEFRQLKPNNTLVVAWWIARSYRAEGSFHFVFASSEETQQKLICDWMNNLFICQNKRSVRLYPANKQTNKRFNTNTSNEQAELI